MIDIIPMPNGVEERDGFFTLKCTTPVICDDDAIYAICSSFAERAVDKYAGIRLTSEGEADEEAIVISRDESLANEEYILDVTPDRLTVKASSYGGYIYALTTLRQLCFADSIELEKVVPCVRISDKPRYKWRGYMFDASRHFFGADEIKRLLDHMTLHKLNVFHWHLSDDQGYRIESKKYPELNRVSTVRNDTMVNGNFSDEYQGIPHGGYYTQEEIREVVKYAADRNITVVPEIDMPGHFSALLAAYPELSCTGEKIAVKTRFGIMKMIACAGKEAVYDFIYGLLDEVCSLFPAPYFHIGGDEAPKDYWKKCPHCQAKIKELGLKDERELQGYFTNRIAEYLAAKGKKTIGWNECLADNLNENVIVQYWTPKRDPKVAQHMLEGRNFIISKHQYTYLDMPHSLISLKKCYSFDPELKEVPEERRDGIMGCEAPLWTEWVYDREKIDLCNFPRLAAIAEAAWTENQYRDFDAFLVRLGKIEKIYDILGINYAKNAVALPKNPFRRLRELKLWFTSDQYIEVRKNRGIK